MKILFMGSPEIAVPSLKALVDSGEQVVGVVAQPDKPAGRGQEIHACAVATYAREHSLPLLQPGKMSEPQFLQAISVLKPDLIVVVAYGKILPRAILEIPPRKCINVHFSLLPKYRGAAPVQWALINGEEETGVTTLFMTDKLDAGPILLQQKVPVEPDDNAQTLSHRLAVVGAKLLVQTIGELEGIHPRLQDETQVLLAPSLEKKDGRLDFSKKASRLACQIRGMNPWPGTWTTLEGKILKVHRAGVVPAKGIPGTILSTGPSGILVGCFHEAILMEEVQIEGKKRMPASEFLKGVPLKPGMKLG